MFTDSECYVICFSSYIEQKLYTGAGAKFICVEGLYNKDVKSRKTKISPPNLANTDWMHIFIQSYSKKRELLSGTKFLYCKYKWIAMISRIIIVITFLLYCTAKNFTEKKFCPTQLSLHYRNIRWNKSLDQKWDFLHAGNL